MHAGKIWISVPYFKCPTNKLTVSFWWCSNMVSCIYVCKVRDHLPGSSYILACKANSQLYTGNLNGFLESITNVDAEIFEWTIFHGFMHKNYFVGI